MIDKYRLMLFFYITRRQFINKCSELELNHWPGDRQTKVLTTMPPPNANSRLRWRLGVNTISSKLRQIWPPPLFGEKNGLLLSWMLIKVRKNKNKIAYCSYTQKRNKTHSLKPSGCNGSLVLTLIPIT